MKWVACFFRQGRITVAAASLLFSPATARAALLAYEPFDYAVGADVLGQNGGFGFGGAWREHAAGSVPAGSFTVTAGSLAHPTQPGDLPTVGNSAVLTGEFGTLQPARDLLAELAGAGGTTTWISFLGQRQGPSQDPVNSSNPNNPYPRGVNVSFFDTQATANPARPERFGVGNSTGSPENEWSIIPEGSGGLRAGSGVSYTDLHWAVLRIDHQGDATVADDYYLWLSPDPTSVPSTLDADIALIGGVDANALDASGIDFIRPFVGNTGSGRPFGVLLLDELRIGTTFAAMTAIPEPTAALLLVCGAAGALLRRRR